MAARGSDEALFWRVTSGQLTASVGSSIRYRGIPVPSESRTTITGTWAISPA
jgi:hypothetical protein